MPLESLRSDPERAPEFFHGFLRHNPKHTQAGVVLNIATNQTVCNHDGGGVQSSAKPLSSIVEKVYRLGGNSHRNESGVCPLEEARPSRDDSDQYFGARPLFKGKGLRNRVRLQNHPRHFGGDESPRAGSAIMECGAEHS